MLHFPTLHFAFYSPPSYLIIDKTDIEDEDRANVEDIPLANSLIQKGVLTARKEASAVTPGGCRP
jgi:hypothetical protein